MSTHKWKNGQTEICCDGGDENGCETSVMLDSDGIIEESGWSKLRDDDHYCPACTVSLQEDGQDPIIIPSTY